MTNRKSEFLDEQATAEFLNMSNRTLQGWRQRGRGPKFVTFGKAVRYSRRELEKFVASSTRQKAPKRGSGKRGGQGEKAGK